MRIGVTLPQFGALAGCGERIGEFAAGAERLGAASLWVGDRLIAPVEPSVGYAGGPGLPEDFRSRLDPFAVLAAAAVTTERVALGASVFVLPLYPPAFLARMLATLDGIAPGRLLPGYGIGWSPEEFEAMGVAFDHRGKRLDEALDALDALLDPQPSGHDGRFWTVPRSHNELHPARRPPVYLGAVSSTALRRVGHRAHGWLPAIQHERGTERALDWLGEKRAVIDQAAREAGRDPAEIETVLRVNAGPHATVEAIAETIRTVTEPNDIRHAFVDLRELAGDTDEALELTGALIAQLSDTPAG